MLGKKNRNRKAQQVEAAPKPRLNELLDIPATALSGVPQIELAGNREALVDGCQGVLEYNEAVIKLATGNMSIRFTGRDLQLKVLTHTSAVVVGFITGIEFIA